MTKLLLFERVGFTLAVGGEESELFHYGLILKRLMAWEWDRLHILFEPFIKWQQVHLSEPVNCYNQ